MTLEGIRPSIQLLNKPLIERIVAEAREVLCKLGVQVADSSVAELLLAAGAKKDDNGRILMTEDLMDSSVKSAPASFKIYDREGKEHADLGDDRVHFTPGSAAINVLDAATDKIRPATTPDYVRYARLVDQLDAIDYQATAFIPSDVDERVSDSIRCYLSLIYGSTPVVTGAFTIEGMHVLTDLMLAIRGDDESLIEKPLSIISCCPTAPLKWSDVTSRNVVDCAKYKIPVEFISMPLTGFVAPGTLVGSLVQHTAETMSGLVISQVANPGTPILWGGSPAVFDYRYETTPMGAVETQMIDCAYAQIGKFLGLPTQAYISLSDSKHFDAQAGMESTSGAILASLAGINSISGPGMLDFESCQSLEKLVMDNEICASAKRLIRGIQPREGEFPSVPHFEELLREGHLIIADHTRKWIEEEIAMPGPVISRANRAREIEEGTGSITERAQKRVAELLANKPNLVDDARRKNLDEVMLRAAKAVGMDELPAHED